MIANKHNPGCCCTDSSFGVCNCTCGETVDMLLIFIDEAGPDYTNNVANYDADVILWNAKVTALGAPLYAQVVEVDDLFTPVGIKPSNRGFPPNWTDDTLVRNPTEAECKAVYNSAKGGAAVAHPSNLVVLGVDNSGSMTTATLGVGYTAFKAYLTAQGVAWVEIEFANERWVKLAAENYEATVDFTPNEIDVTFSDFLPSSTCTALATAINNTFTLTCEEPAPSALNSVCWDSPNNYDGLNYCFWSIYLSAGSAAICSDVAYGNFYRHDTSFQWTNFILTRYKIDDGVNPPSSFWRLQIGYRMYARVADVVLDADGNIVVRAHHTVIKCDDFYYDLEMGAYPSRCTFTPHDVWAKTTPTSITATLNGESVTNDISYWLNATGDVVLEEVVP